MTEETLKCPFCEEELLEIDKHKKIYDCQGKIQLLNLTLDCIAHDLYLQGWEDLVYKIISIKQKSYSEGYEKGKEESIGYMHKNVCQICKQNRQDEGRMAVCMPCYKMELEK
jgi:hypothetical protein